MSSFFWVRPGPPSSVGGGYLDQFVHGGQARFKPRLTRRFFCQKTGLKSKSYVRGAILQFFPWLLWMDWTQVLKVLPVCVKHGSIQAFWITAFVPVFTTQSTSQVPYKPNTAKNITLKPTFKPCSYPCLVAGFFARLNFLISSRLHYKITTRFPSSISVVTFFFSPQSNLAPV